MNDLNHDMETTAGNPPEAIAIIGMDGRFPGAADIAGYWKNLLEGRETIDRYALDALDVSVPESLRTSPDYVPVRGRMPEADRFDAAFFGISPREAEVLDPQQRVFLEMCWRALEDAGLAPGTHDALTGVFAGMSNNTYFHAHVAKHPDILASVGEIPAMVANEKDYLTTRVAYKLNLRGPCINITTACSTSLVAVCHAVNSLLDYHCDVALAGGVAVSCPQERGYLYNEGSIHSSDGKCRPFDAAAAGTVFSNGGGVVVLKRLSEAVADGDTIHAVIRGAAMNNDGAGKVSFTAPSVDGQADVIEMAQEMAGIDPGQIGYVEAHGTGTTLGDPIEIAALTQAFRKRTNRRGYCAIGSVKSNIGHLDAASGIAGLIKACLVVREGKLPATLNYREPNPALCLDDTPFHVVDTLRDWPTGALSGGSPANGPRRAAVSSFGLGGTNAHVIIEQAPPRKTVASTRARQLLVLSAKTEAALDRAREALADHLEQHPHIDLADAAFTLQAGRQAFEHRLAVSADSAPAAVSRLRENLRSAVVRGQAGRAATKTVFMFPGQGSQYVGMAGKIYQGEPLVRDIVDRCADTLRDTLAFDLRDVMFGKLDNAAELIDETAYTQPALFVLEYALAKLWIQWGVQPSVLLGHSIGEFAAAALADVFSVEDGARVVAERARLMQRQPPGSMLSVRLPEAEIAARLQPGVTLAAVNAPGLCVLSGDTAAITRMQHRLEAENIGCSVLRTSHAFHSAMMDPAVAAFEDFVRGIALAPPRIDIISTVTGESLSAAAATDPAYWARQLRDPVRFMDALQAAHAGAPSSMRFLEVGPGIATTTFATQTFADEDNVEITATLGRRQDNADEYDALLTAAGKLWTCGQGLDWKALHGGETRHRIPMPTYRFERTRYWLDSAPAATAATRSLPATSAPVQEDPVAMSRESGQPLIAQVAALLTEASGIPADKLDMETPFTELGLDSLLLTQFSQMLRRRFGLNLRFRQLLVEHNNVKAISGLLERETAIAAAAKETLAAKEAAIVEPAEPAAREKAPARNRDADTAFGPGARIRRHALMQLTSAQKDYLADLCKRYTWRTSGSKAFVRTHRGHLADPRTVSGFDPVLKEMVYPVVMQSSSGGRIQDVDGNCYVDLVNGFGSALLGHSPSFVTEAIRQQLKRGYATGPQTPLAGRVARLLQALTGLERFSFCTTGSEAVQAALRVARTVTGRDRVVMFSDDYHGIFDEVLARRGPDGQAMPASPGVPQSLLQNIEVLEYGARDSLDRIAAIGNTLAAVLVEPVQDRHPERHSPGFLRDLRAITRKTGSALIFDESVTGFRVHPGGMQGLLDIRADLATYGKICGGGMPLGVLGGIGRFMDALDGGDWAYGDDSAPEADVTFFAGTHIRHPLSLAAAEATLGHLREAGPALQRRLAERTAALARELEMHCEETGAPVRIRQFSSWFLIDVDPGVPYGGLLYYRLRVGGVHAWEGRLCFLSTAHSEADLAQIARVFREALDEMRAAGFFEGIPRDDAEPVEKVADLGATGTDNAPPVPQARLGRRPDGQPGWFIPDPERPGRYREVRTS